ncbi:hypothetical protein C8Q69DRAFT_92116 [Paecilomyces variotii]|uniref:Uncharacterized protein n=1 Tax=Byssochlamys spectabilis TaxID=264951 RepID=A0A443HLU9_BYSSP|nr:hypothetical protein C8Q69DRAFT_92116 [Paecilomyces variotii]RWQ92785.1 hypothetical protein C8Q69DRAFT_92116 [Paecilomyces variotii]
MFARIEQYLLDHGCVESAVKVQNTAKIFEIFYRSKGPQKKWINRQLDNEIARMAMIQYEIGTDQKRLELEKRQKFNGDLTEEEKNELEGHKAKMASYNKRWWFLNQKYHSHLFNKPKGSYIREFDLYQNGYVSYTQEEVQRACKAIGGCCAYDCGCCYRERESSRKPGLFMHCREGCICCQRRRNQRDTTEILDLERNQRAWDIMAYDYCSINLEKRL